MNEGRPLSWPEDIERLIQLGEGNGYAQPWESTRKGPSLLAELAERTGKDVNALTPAERIAFHIGWVRGRIRKYEETGIVDPAEIVRAKENEQFYRDKLRQILETPPNPPLSPAPTPIPATPLPESHETPPEAPSFSRHLHKILEDLTSPEAINLLNKLKSDNGRLWIDKKKADGSTVRIWLSLDLTPEEKAKPPTEFIGIVKAKLAPGFLRFRVDEGATSWRTEWEGKKNAILPLVNKLTTAPKDKKLCEELAASPFLGIPDDRKQAFVELLATYLTKDGEEKNIWTNVRNAYWHTVGWKTQADVPDKLDELNVKLPSYDTAKIRVWEKVEKKEVKEAIVAKEMVKLHRAGQPISKWGCPSGEENPKNGFYHFASATGNLWIREEHLRISYAYDPIINVRKDDIFELMAWQAQSEEPNGASVPPVAHPPKPKSGTTPAAPKPSGPVTPSEPKGPSLKPAAPVTAPPVPQPPKGPTTTHPPSPKKGPPANIWEERKKATTEDFVIPTDDNLTDAWLKAHIGTKLELKTKGSEGKLIKVMVHADQKRTKAGEIHLHYITDNGGRGNEYFNIAELRRLNLSPPARP